MLSGDAYAQLLTEHCQATNLLNAACRRMEEGLIGYKPDILGVGLDAVFCGLNPATSAAEAGHNFSSPSNRFWRVLHLAGFTDVQLLAHDEQRLLEFGVGITAVVRRPTRRAEEISGEEFRSARRSFEAKLRRYGPRSVAFLGKRAFSAMTKHPVVGWGRQSTEFAGTMTWVLPNPSGLNRNFTLDDLTTTYTEFRLALFADAPTRSKQTRLGSLPV